MRSPVHLLAVRGWLRREALHPVPQDGGKSAKSYQGSQPVVRGERAKRQTSLLLQNKPFYCLHPVHSRALGKKSAQIRQGSQPVVMEELHYIVPTYICVCNRKRVPLLGICLTVLGVVGGCLQHRPLAQGRLLSCRPRGSGYDTYTYLQFRSLGQRRGGGLSHGVGGSKCLPHSACVLLGGLCRGYRSGFADRVEL